MEEEIRDEERAKKDKSHLDLLIFEIEGRFFGINVAKVREIVNYSPLTVIPRTNPNIEGVFMPRDEMITVVDLKRALHMGSSEPRGSLIVTGFNNLSMAFHVGNIRGIVNVTWEDLMEPGKAVTDLESGLTTGIINKDGNLVVVLDFERIVAEINPETGLKVSDVGKYENRTRDEIPILLAEDSMLLNKLIVEYLSRAGYTNLIHTANGREAWELIEKWRDEGTLDDHVKLVITDIEMPQMDGHKLTQLIKSDRRTSRLKVVIFSSMINDVTRKKGEELGADAQMSKPEIGLLVGEIDKLLGKEVFK